MATTHWHVRRHGDDDDPFIGDLVTALEYAADEMDRIVDHEHEGITGHGEGGDFEEAYRAFQRTQTYAALEANLRNMHKQHSSPMAERAPLYAGPVAATSDDRLKLALTHVLESVHGEGPTGFAMWECPNAECELAPTDEVPCAKCQGDTIPPDPRRPEETGSYCEACGVRSMPDGTTLL